MLLDLVAEFTCNWFVEYTSYEQMVYVRDLLLDCWSQFLVLMKNVWCAHLAITLLGSFYTAMYFIWVYFLHYEKGWVLFSTPFFHFQLCRRIVVIQTRNQFSLRRKGSKSHSIFRFYSYPRCSFREQWSQTYRRLVNLFLLYFHQLTLTVGIYCLHFPSSRVSQRLLLTTSQ